MSDQKPGNTAYIIESGRTIREVEILHVSGRVYSVRFKDTGGGIKLREGRLYPSKEAAEVAANNKKVI